MFNSIGEYSGEGYSIQELFDSKSSSEELKQENSSQFLRKQKMD